MNELDNLRMELEALKLFSAEQEEENERLRAENATLRDKLEQKYGYGIDLAKGPDYSSVEMLLAPQYSMYELYRRDQKISTRQEDMLITVGFDEMNQCYEFGMRGRHSEPHYVRLDERAAHEVDARMMREITNKLLYKVLGNNPDAHLLNRTMHKLFERFMEAVTKPRMKDYVPYNPKLAKRLKRSSDDRDTRDHPRSPLQRGGR